MWVLQHYSVHAFDMSTIIDFMYLGLQVKWNQISSNNSHHTSCIHKGVTWWEVAWPNDLQTRLCQYTGIPLIRPHWKTTGATSILGCHWNHTGWCYHPVQWCPSDDQVLICIIETHWKATGKSLEHHRKTTGSTLATNNYFSCGIPVYTGV